MNAKISLDMIAVAAPCSALWDQMSGDHQARFCNQCGQHVYNLSEMTQKDAEALVLKHEGKLCVRFYQRLDGTMMTRDCPVGWRAARQRMRILVGMAGAFLGAVFSVLLIGAVEGGHARAVEDKLRFNPIDRLCDWLYPPPPGPPRPCVMGDASIRKPDPVA